MTDIIYPVDFSLFAERCRLANHTAKMKTPAELIAFAKEVIRPMPEPRPGPVGLLGFTGTIGFVCSTCSGKIVERGIALKQFANEPVWQAAVAEPTRTCALCDKKV